MIPPCLFDHLHAILHLKGCNASVVVVKGSDDVKSHIPGGAVATGAATITVTATDANTATATQTFFVGVIASDALVSVGSNSGPNGVTVNVSAYFSDPNGDTLTYTASSSDTTKATVNKSGSSQSL